MHRWSTHISLGMTTWLVMVGIPAQGQDAASPDRAAISGFVTRYCAGCHNGDDKEKAAGLDLDQIDSEALDRHPDAWEKVVRRLAARQMPPEGSPRPPDADYDSVVARLGAPLD